MPDITRIQIADEPERSYKDFPANREFKKRAEDENSGSSSDPILENAKQTGGIGWTEQGNQTTITWDGDVEGRDSFNTTLGGVTFYKVAEKGTGYTDYAGVSDNVNDGTFDVQFVSGENAFAYCTVIDFPCVIVADGGEFTVTSGEVVFTAIAPSAGVYFVYMGEEYITSLAYGTPDTVHKIDEKYISGGSEPMYVEFQGADLGSDGWSAFDTITDLTSDEWVAIGNDCLNDVRKARNIAIRVFDYDDINKPWLIASQTSACIWGDGLQIYFIMPSPFNGSPDHGYIRLNFTSLDGWSIYAY